MMNKAEMVKLESRRFIDISDKNLSQTEQMELNLLNADPPL